MATYTQFEPRKALKAIRELLDNPDDLPKVFTILEALSGGTLSRLHATMARDETGVRLLAERPDIVPLLQDRDALRRLPAGTVGRAYLDFVESEGISAQGIRDANVMGRTHDRVLPPPLDYVQARMRDTHDLWHAVTGYKGGLLGELALLAFSLAQTWNPGVALIVVAGVLKISVTELTNVEVSPTQARAVVFDGFRRGRRAAWLPAQRWEDLLALPLEEARSKLRLGRPAQYTELRSDQLRAVAAAA